MPCPADETVTVLKKQAIGFYYYPGDDGLTSVSTLVVPGGWMETSATAGFSNAELSAELFVYQRLAAPISNGPRVYASRVGIGNFSYHDNLGPMFTLEASFDRKAGAQYSIWAVFTFFASGFGANVQIPVTVSIHPFHLFLSH